MKAKKKPLETVAVSELGVDVSPTLTTANWEPPEERQKGVMVDSVEALVNRQTVSGPRYPAKTQAEIDTEEFGEWSG